MGIQVIALRTVPDDDLYHIVELIVRDDEDGRLAYVDRNIFSEWANDNPQMRVYIRTAMGENKAVLTFAEASERFISTALPPSSRDEVLRLPRFLSAIRPPEVPPNDATTSASGAPWWWPWWAPR